jgi:hypothetical protein
MAKFRLNRKSLERLKGMIRAGKYVDRPGGFTVEDSNNLAGDPPNWTEFQQCMLGIEQSRPESPAENGTESPDKSWYAYPFTNDGAVANLSLIRDIVKQSAAAGETDIADAATEALSMAAVEDRDKQTTSGQPSKSASGAACDRNIRFTAPANVKAATKKKGPPTFDADAYTGGAMELDGWTHPVVIDYDGLDITKKSRPVLRDHDPTLPLGHTTHIGVDRGILKAKGVISASGKHVREVVDAAKQNFPWQVSVGAKVLKNQFVPEGETARANGRTFDGPVNIARRTALREISLLTLGADDDTSARIAAKAARKKAVMDFDAWLAAKGFKAADLTGDQCKAMKEMHAAEAEAANAKSEDDDSEDDDAEDDDSEDSGSEDSESDDDSEDDAEERDGKHGKSEARRLSLRANRKSLLAAASKTRKVVRAAAVSERKRIAGITAALEEYRPHIEAKKFAEIEAKALDGEYNRTRTELELIKAKRPMHTPMINTGAGSNVTGAIVAAAAARSAGVNEKAAFHGLDERSGNIAASMKGISLHKIIAMSAAQLGMHVSPGGIDDEFLNDFFPRDKQSHRQQVQAAKANGTIFASSSSGFSTMSLTGITENILNKALLETYGQQESVVSDIAYERDTNDFKPFKVYRLTASGDFQLLGPGGEVKLMSLQDESYANQVVTKAVLVVLKREDAMNDDLGALMQSPQILGRKAALNREKTVIAAWLSGTTTLDPGPSIGKPANSYNFWSTGAKNYQSGGGSALSLTSLQTAEQKFLEQKDANGDPVGIPPDRLLVAPANKVPAENLFGGANLMVQALTLPVQSAGSSAAQTGSQVPNLNYFRNKYRPLVSPYLSAQFLGNDTQWGLLCSPAGGMATVQVGYLRGQRTPIIRQVDTDSNQLGIAFQAIYDFGVSLHDSRCGQYSAGQ